MSYYVCATFDAYDPVTGFFVMKMDCIEWNEEDLGPWLGPKYNTKEECYARSVCVQGPDNNPTIPQSNNYCNININLVSLVDRTQDSLTFNINLPSNYEDTYIEYALYDIEYNELSTFKRMSNTPNPLQTSGTFTIQDNFNNVCAIAFRLVKPCDIIESSGGSGSQKSGDSGESGSGTDEEDTVLTGILFDKSSWAEIIPEPFKTYADAAADIWNLLLRYNPIVYNLIKENKPEWNGLALNKYSQFNDPAVFYVAACGPTETIDITNNNPNNIKFNSVTFSLLVNEYYLNNQDILLSSADWINVMVHELGHALGIGYWKLLDSYWLDGNEYTLAKNAYNTITGHIGARYRIPLEDSGNPGTASAHWENNNRSSEYPNSDGFSYPNCNFDVMVGYITIGSPKPISNLSKQYLVDIGYESLTSSPPSIVIEQSNIMINDNEPVVIQNMCGAASACHCGHSMGTINLIDNIFIQNTSID
jgi:hypothetical protein